MKVSNMLMPLGYINLECITVNIKSTLHYTFQYISWKYEHFVAIQKHFILIF